MPNAIALSEEFVTAPLYTAGLELRFFSPTKDREALTATLLAWSLLQDRVNASALPPAAQTLPASEDAWYGEAQRLYTLLHGQLSREGLTPALLEKLKHGYLQADSGCDVRKLLSRQWGCPV